MLRRPVIGAFSLLEVMVAIAILGLMLTAIFSAQAGAIRTGARARSISTATLLARCKMGEIEETMVREGFPAIHADGEDGCCEDGEMDGFTCEWTVDRITLPEASEMQGGDPLGLAGGVGTGSATDQAASGQQTDAMTGMLAGGGAGDMISMLAMQYAFPILKPFIEDQVRRATVTVHWQEGQSSRSFDVTQFIVQDQGTTIPVPPP